MTQAYVDANQFASVWLKSRSMQEFKAAIGYTTNDDTSAFRRRRNVEKELGITLPAFSDPRKGSFPVYQNVSVTCSKPTVFLIGSDRHNIPGDTPQAFMAFLHLASELKPDYIVINGDWFDFSAIGRFHRIGWQDRPAISTELEDGVAKLKDVEKASPRSKRLFTLGNHDMRFDGKLSNCMPDLEGVEGCALSHYLKKWQIGLSITVNDMFVIKHRWHGGQHAAYNNALRSGKNIATGHTHHLKIEPWTDYNGIRYAIETGTLSDLWDETFIYTENNPSNWQPGCAVVTVDQNLIFPQVCPMVVDKHHSRWGKIHHNGKWYG